MGKRFSGRTEDADSPFLGAEFWKPGVEISGTVIRTFESSNGRCYVLDLVKPVQLNGEPVDRVSIGNLRGFLMVLQAASLERLEVRDQVHLKSTSLKPTDKGSPMPCFEIEVYRPAADEKAAASAA